MCEQYKDPTKHVGLVQCSTISSSHQIVTCTHRDIAKNNCPLGVEQQSLTLL